MLGTVGKTTPQALIVDEERNYLHAPVRLARLRGLQPISQQKPKQLAPVRARTPRCRVSAILSLSQTQTQSLSDGPGMATEGVEVAIPELQKLCQDALSTLGYTDQQAAIVTEVHCSAAPNWRVVFF